MMAKAVVTRSTSTVSEVAAISGRPWLRYAGWVRVLLAALVLGLSYPYLPDPSEFVGAIMAVFVVYSFVMAFRGKGFSGMLGLLGLFGDTVYFLFVANFGTARLLWPVSLFYFFLLAEALLFYTAVQMALVAGVCTMFGLLVQSGALQFLEPTIAGAGILGFAAAAWKQRRLVQIDGLEEKLREAQKAAEKARELERQRIASDFHDGPLQSFISLQMRLEILRKLLDRDFHAGMQDLKQLQQLAVGQIRDLRAFLHSMRPVDVDGANLLATARRMAETFQKESGIPVTFLGSNSPVGLPQEMSMEVLQMLREALHNVQKHAGASRVAVSMEKTDRGLEISVEDNGHGFSFAGAYNLEELELLRLGPASLKRRARTLNADMLLESRPGRGAGLKFRIPLQ
jgi:signal transduction histidine kinase